MRRRRGVSEIVASLVVLIIVSVLGILLFNTSQSAVSGQSQNMLSTAQFEGEKAQERFEVVSVEFNSTSPSAIRLNVLNFSPSKTLEIKIDAIYINSTKVNFTPTNPTLKQHNVTRIMATLNGPSFESEKIYILLLVSERGVGYAYNWKTPKFP